MRRKIVFLSISLLLLFLLTACGASLDQTVTFYQGGAWEAEMTIELPAEAMGLAGGPVRAQIEDELEAAVTEFEAQGIEASWEQVSDEGVLSYIVHARGEGYDVLRQVGFEDATITVEEVDGREAIHFTSYVPPEISLGGQSSITLIGREIISTNGREVEKGTVQWVNPSGRVEAVLVGKSRLAASPFLLPAALLAGVVLVAGGGLLVWRRGRGGQYCSVCGTPLAPDARFCSGCGRQLA